MSRLAGSKMGSNQQSSAQEIILLKAKIKDLEGEVGRLKSVSVFLIHDIYIST